MAMLALGILLVVVGLVLAFSNAFGLAALGGAIIWVGWICVAIGVVLAILHFIVGPRRAGGVVVERRRYREL